MSDCCPKCASVDVRKLSLVYGSDQGALSRVAAPPVKKPWATWAATAVLSFLPVFAHVREPGPGTVLMMGISALTAGFAFNAWTYNARVHPALLERWQRSFLCNRCGNVFISS